jgi:hypothetical protein
MNGRPGFFNPANNDVELQIKQTFYNGLGEFVISQPNVSPENLDRKIAEGIGAAIRNVLAISRGKNGVHLPQGGVITSENCPEIYQNLFHILIQLKDRPVVSDDHINQLAQNMMQYNAFHQTNPRQFLLEALGFADAPHLRRFDDQGVTAELIRNSFYHEMVNQGLLAVTNEWLDPDDLCDSDDGRIYITLPALTLLEAAHQSRQYPDAVRLLDDKMLTKVSCPKEEKFPELLDMMLKVKHYLVNITNVQLDLVKHNLCCKSKNTKPVTPVLSDFIAILKGMGIEISRSKVFQKMVLDVIAICDESLEEAKGLKM